MATCTRCREARAAWIVKPENAEVWAENLAKIIEREETSYRRRKRQDAIICGPQIFLAPIAAQTIKSAPDFLDRDAEWWNVGKRRSIVAERLAARRPFQKQVRAITHKKRPDASWTRFNYENLIDKWLDQREEATSRRKRLLAILASDFWFYRRPLVTDLMAVQIQGYWRTHFSVLAAA